MSAYQTESLKKFEDSLNKYNNMPIVLFFYVTDEYVWCHCDDNFLFSYSAQSKVV